MTWPSQNDGKGKGELEPSHWKMGDQVTDVEGISHRQKY